MPESRISGLHKLSVRERIDKLHALGWLSASAADALRQGRHVMQINVADKMIENVIGTFSLPFAVAPNFVINGNNRLAPLVVEEPSIVAALSSAAALAAATGGFRCEIDESLLIGQIHLTDVADPDAAMTALRSAKQALMIAANAVHPRLATRGGGVRDIEFGRVESQQSDSLVAVHILVDTCDAMGANLVNTICESIAPQIAELTAGSVALRILSNMTDRSIAKATVRFNSEALAIDGVSGAEICRRIVIANDIARDDQYRAVTHNKGIMNGIDAVAVATGNDWRAIEAAVHAYASRAGKYKALTDWTVDTDGDLVGTLEIPIKVATVGGTLSSNPAAQLALALSGVESATELAMFMTAVGLAQNFSALRALVGDGIQNGHMRLHARSLAMAAGADTTNIDAVVAALQESGEIKAWNAREIVSQLQRRPVLAATDSSRSAGKVILLGEHAVVYGGRALAIPVHDAVLARAEEADAPTRLRIDDWGLDEQIEPELAVGIAGAVNLIKRELGIEDRHFAVYVETELQRGAGLGSSAAVVVAVIRAIAKICELQIADKRVNDIAFQCEELAHGTPSGVDNTVSCFARPMLYSNAAGQQRIEELQSDDMPRLLLAFSNDVGLTSDIVAAVRRRRQSQSQSYDAIFEHIDALAGRGAQALEERDWQELGALMNINHGLLNAIGVSTPELESMVAMARASGALGAKLTGAGGGGAIVALCPSQIENVRSAFIDAGYETLLVNEDNNHRRESSK